MPRLLTSPLISAALLFATWLQAEEPKKSPVPGTPHPALAPIEDVPNLPRVLLMGDSISMGYTLPVRARLQGRANIHHPAENCGDTGRGLRRLEAWLGAGRWDVIYFNFGLHDLKYLDAQGKYVPPEQGTQVTPLPQYEANLRELVARLQRTGARLIYATTTPVPGGTLGRVEHDERAYNEVARRVMQETGVPVDDLHALVSARQAEIQLPNNVHFTPAGYEQLGEHVTASLTAALPPVRR
jgi:lysophospholipase L1-like esterase